MHILSDDIIAFQSAVSTATGYPVLTDESPDALELYIPAVSAATLLVWNDRGATVRVRLDDTSEGLEHDFKSFEQAVVCYAFTVKVLAAVQTRVCNIFAL